MHSIKNFILIFFFSHYFACAQKSEPYINDDEKENSAIRQAIISNLKISDYFKKVERDCAELKNISIHPVHCTALTDAFHDMKISSRKGQIFGRVPNDIAAVANFNLKSGSGSYRNYLFVLSPQADGTFEVRASRDLQRANACIMDTNIENATIVIPLLESKGGVAGRCLPVLGASLQFIWKNEQLQEIPARQTP